jgi:N-acetylneuraminate synthase
MTVAGRPIGNGAPTFVIAELSANHHGSLEEALQLVHAARGAGADAVKLQTYTADTLTIDAEGPDFTIGDGTLWSGRRLYDLYHEAFTPWEWHAPLLREAERLGLVAFSTAFDPTSVDFLERLGVPAHKVASFELVDLPLVRRLAGTGKPLILSTGMASLEEIAEAVAAAREAGATGLALLKCTSAYPAPPEEMHLRTIPDLAARFGVPVGLSDHTLGIAAPVAAVALGAAIVEKHFTLSRTTPGPDSAFSLEPAEFRAMVEAIRTAEAALGRVSYEVGAREGASRIFRRSLYVVADVRAGEPFTPANLRSIRPSYGLAPKHLPAVLGRPAACDLARGTALTWAHVGTAAEVPAEAGLRAQTW